MYKNTRVGVVVPAYTEGGLVSEVIETIPSFVDRIYAVDDASTDATWEEIKSCASKVADEPEQKPIPEQDVRVPTPTDGGTNLSSRVVAIRHETNQGVGGAIKTGYRRAAQDDMEVIAVMNGDGQMDPDSLDRIIDPIVEGNADYAKGNRLRYRSYREGMTRWRFFGNTILTFLTKIASGYWKMMDPQNGYTAISREAIETIDLDGVYEEYGFCNDILVRLNVHEFRVADVDLPAIYGEEESHISYSHFIPTVSWLLLRDFFWRLYMRYIVFDFHPLVLLYVIGITSGTIGLAHGVISLFQSSSLLVTSGIVVTQLLLSSTVLVFAMVFDKLYNVDLLIRA